MIFKQVLAKAKREILPKIVNDAKSSGKSAAKRVFDDRRGHIIAIGLIPFYGWVKGQMLIADAKRDANKDAKNAAIATVNNQFNSSAVTALRDLRWPPNKLFHKLANQGVPNLLDVLASLQDFDIFNPLSRKPFSLI